ncbi:NAD(P)H-binding protein [Curtobacterium sp. MCBD17_040]|uniref:NAD(P)-dependent oxidoreductase n=1 Tax=Curtobacterium sp. MCBD17_040 TaxID=2175674 RepID=UPI000DA71017|nr:NAD(P)H-binding protein [Curtobacterium sp. MCBD17_040]WIB63543.1 NAD(P)H-binding protein [Curtobacterium sp. MCBD17_040]
MSRISVIGGTGYAGSAIVAEAASRGHEVTSLSRSLPTDQVPGVRYVQGDASDEAVLTPVIEDADVVVAALAPRGDLTDTFREVNRTIARRAASAGARLFVVGGFSSLRPAPGAPRYVEDLSAVPAELHHEVQSGAALILEDLPAAPDALDWVFVSPPLQFGSFAPGERTGSYRVGTDVAVVAEGGAISAQDYAIGFVDQIERTDLHRTQVNLAN